MGEIAQPVEGDRPVLALDIDGVFVMLDEGQSLDEYELIPGTNHYHRPIHGEWIKELLPSFDVYYLATAGPNSHKKIGKYLGLPELDWINYRLYEDIFERDMEELSKDRRTALDNWFIDRPIAWVDDSLKMKDFEWAQERTEEGTPTLVLKTYARQGLVRGHIDKIHSWLGEQALDSE